MMMIIALWHYFIHQMIFVLLRISLFRGYLCYYATNAFVYYLQYLAHTS